MTVKARHHARSIATLAALVAASGVVSVGAQPVRTPPRPDTPRLVVQVFGSTDKVAGPAASDALRERLISAFPSRVLWVFSKEEVVGFIEQSGYPTTEQLGRNDEATLAKFLRADEYIRGNVTKNGEVYRVTAQLVLTRDAGLTQPLPAVEDRRADRAAAGLVKAIQDARKQLDNEKRCRDLATQDKLAEAVAVADAGIAEYPNATLVRYCKINVLVRRKAPSADLLAAANEILAIDPNSKVALSIAADAQKEAGNTDAANELLVRLLATDPTNASLATQVVDALAASRKYDMAKKIVDEAVVNNPGDIGLIRLQFLIQASSGEYKAAIKTGEEMVQMDTSLADAPYFVRMAALYAADSQPQKASEAAARGTQKFPNNAELWQLHAQTLRAAGQLQQSIASATRALEIDPKIAGGWMQIAVSYNDLKQPDSAFAALQKARAAGDNADQIATYAVAFGNRQFQAAVADSSKTVASFEKPLPLLHLADTLATDAAVKGNAKLLIGVANYYMAQVLAQGLQASKSCEDARKAEASATTATINVQAGGRTSPETAAQVLTAVSGLLPYLQQSVKTFCK
jgi:tetratricopeptide (TPR) repeat protein